jgi:hypothetical protein
MDNSSEIEKSKNQFEIEERVLKALKDQEDIIYFNTLQKTKSNTSTQEERLKSTNKRKIYWNNLATTFLNKYFLYDIKQITTTTLK